MFVFFLTSCQTTKIEKPAIEPSPQDRESILDHQYFLISYNKDHMLPNWVRYSLTAEKLKIKKAKRRNKFLPDPLLARKGWEPVLGGDYKKSGYDRGHMAPSEDFVWDQSVNNATFYMTNIAPQLGSLNRGPWKVLEEKVRRWACFEENITVITGPLLEANLPKIKSKISIPKKFFKVIVDETPPKKSIGFIFNQTDKSGTDIKSRAVSVAEIEKSLGYSLRTHLEEKLKQSHSYISWKEKDCRKK